MIEKLIPHSFQLIDNPNKYSHQIWRDLDRNYNILVNRVNSFINPEKDTIVIENIDNSIQNYVLFQILSTISSIKDVPIVVIRKYFKRVPKFMKTKGSHVEFCSERGIENKGLNKISTKIFSPFMLHNCLDGKFSDNSFSKITFYPFKDFPLQTLELVAEKFFGYTTKEEKWESFYNNILQGNTTPEILQAYKIFHKTSCSMRVILVHEIEDIVTFANFLNFNANVLPIYVGKEINPTLVNYYIKNISQRVPNDYKGFDDSEIEKFAEDLKQTIKHNVCGELGCAPLPIKQSIEAFLKTYDIGEEVKQYGKV